ncbi:hypothetical protein K443DRAFT_99625, partial [Laccaria amethystina LaAM-08-1]
ETPLPADTFPRLGKLSPHTLSNHNRRHLPNAQPTAIRPPRLAQLRALQIKTAFTIQCRLIEHKSNMVPSPLSLSVFRGFNVLPRGLLSRTWKQTSTLRVHGPLVRGEGEGKKMPNVLELRLVAFRARWQVRRRY